MSPGSGRWPCLRGVSSVPPDLDPPEMGNEDPAFEALLERARHNVASTEAAEVAA
jgi:hypothetical protein